MKKGLIWWGVALIAVAVLLILNTVFTFMGMFDSFPVVSIILGAACLGWIVAAIARGPVAFIYYPIAFIFMLFEKNIAQLCNITDGTGAIMENFVSNWLVFLCATLLCIGTGFLTRSCKHRKFKKNIKHGERVQSSKFSSSTKYIDCTTFSSETIEVNMGACEVYFENADSYAGGGNLNIDVNMGSLRIHIPAGWHITAIIENNFGNVRIPVGAVDGKEININGDCNMGNIEVLIDA